MSDVDQLLNDLNAMTPITPDFAAELRPVMKTFTIGHGKVLLHLNKIAKKAWYVLDGYLVAIALNKKGSESVVKLFFPHMIAAELHSFFEQKFTRFKIVAVGEVTVQEINKKDFERLKKYPETFTLVQHIMLMEEEAESKKAELLKLPAAEKVKLFLEWYPAADLMDEYCASYLDLSVEEYMEQKRVLNLSDHACFEESVRPVSGKPANSQNVAHEVRVYILQNFTDPQIGNTIKIAEKFYTTKKTLTRAFKDAFNSTVHDMIIKVRMERAQVLLKKTGMDVGKVSVAVGYQNIYTFSRTFKHYFGYTPSQFIKS